MEFIGRMQAVFLAYFPQVIIIFSVLLFLIHHYLYMTSNVITIFSSFIVYKSLDWHNHKADSEYLKFSEKNSSFSNNKSGLTLGQCLYQDKVPHLRGQNPGHFFHGHTFHEFDILYLLMIFPIRQFDPYPVHLQGYR